MDVSFPPEQPFEVGGISHSRRLLSDVFLLYREQFRRWFGITAPTSLAAAVILLMADQQVRAVFQSIPRGQIPFHLAELAETFVLRFGGFFIAWFLGAFALGAIATVVSNLTSDDHEVWRSDSHQLACEHLGALFLVALLTFCLFLVGMLLVEVAALAIVREVGWSHFSRFSVATALIGYVIVASIVSWFGMAIPLILRANIGAWAALKKSMQVSNGYEGFLFLLVIESLVGSYVGLYATYYGLALLLPASIRYAAWYGWVVYFVGALASAAVQPPIFIGFALLAEKSQTEPANA